MFENFGLFLYHITDRAAELYERLNLYAVGEIVRRLVRAGEMNEVAANMVYKMQEAGKTMQSIKEEVARHSGLSEKEVNKAFEDAAIEAINGENAVYKKAGYGKAELLQSKRMRDVLDMAKLQTNNELKNITRTMADKSQSIYINALDEAWMKVQSGMVSYETAIAEAIKEVSGQGLYIRYPSGRRDTIETAVRRALMTGLNQGTIRAQLAQMEEMGQDLLITSQHVGARTGGKHPYEDHSKWQGRVFSVSGTSDKYPSFTEECGWGKGGGIGGWNCRHHVNVFIEGISTIPGPIDEEKNKKLESLNAKQRRIEAAIRAKKRELAGVKEAMEATGSDKMKFELQQLHDKAAEELKGLKKRYGQFCKENNLRTWNERTRIVRTERERGYKDRLETGADTTGREIKKTDSLTEQEQGAVIRYKSPEAYSLNDKLRRNAESEFTELEREWMNNLDRALKKLPNYEGTLNRSLYFNRQQDVEEAASKFVSGKEYVAEQYLSTTKDEVYNKDGQIQIYIKGAKRGKDLYSISTIENEVLYPIGTRFKVIRKHKKNEKYIILLEEVD